MTHHHPLLLTPWICRHYIMWIFWFILRGLLAHVFLFRQLSFHFDSDKDKGGGPLPILSANLEPEGLCPQYIQSGSGLMIQSDAISEGSSECTYLCTFLKKERHVDWSMRGVIGIIKLSSQSSVWKLRWVEESRFALCLCPSDDSIWVCKIMNGYTIVNTDTTAFHTTIHGPLNYRHGNDDLRFALFTIPREMLC